MSIKVTWVFVFSLLYISSITNLHEIHVYALFISSNNIAMQSVLFCLNISLLHLNNHAGVAGSIFLTVKKEN